MDIFYTPKRFQFCDLGNFKLKHDPCGRIVSAFWFYDKNNIKYINTCVPI